MVATGPCRIPFLPAWPGAPGFTGELLHSADYRRPGDFTGRDVLVVGAGNSAAEVAAELTSTARRVRLAVRTPPVVVARTFLGVPTILVAVLGRRLPAWIGDGVMRALGRMKPGDLERHGLPQAHDPISEHVARNDVIPISHPGFVERLREGRIEVVRAVRGFDGAAVVLEGGARIEPEVVIAATGYRSGLAALLGPLPVLDGAGPPLVHGAVTHAAAPGLHFIGYTNPLSGNLRELRLDAERIARALATRPHPAVAPARVSSAG